MPELEQVRGEGPLMVRGFVKSILRDEIGLPIVKYTLRIIIAQNGFKCALVVCLKLQLG